MADYLIVTLIFARLPIGLLAGLIVLSPQPGRAQITPNAPTPPWSLGVGNVTVLTVPAAVRDLVTPDLEFDDADPIYGVRVDLNGDGADDYFIQSDRSLCGTGGCVWDLVDGRTSTVLFQTLADPLFVLAARTRGYPNLATYTHLSADSGTYATWAFNGTKYVTTQTRTVRGAELDTLFTTLRRIPAWPRH